MMQLVKLNRILGIGCSYNRIESHRTHPCRRLRGRLLSPSRTWPWLLCTSSRTWPWQSHREPYACYHLKAPIAKRQGQPTNHVDGKKSCNPGTTEAGVALVVVCAVSIKQCTNLGPRSQWLSSSRCYFLWRRSSCRCDGLGDPYLAGEIHRFPLLFTEFHRCSVIFIGFHRILCICSDLLICSYILLELDEVILISLDFCSAAGFYIFYGFDKIWGLDA